MDRIERTTEVRDDSTHIAPERDSVSPIVLARRVISYLIGLIILLLALRIVLLLLAANQGNGFVDFIYGLSGIFAAPFYGIFNYQPAYGASTLEVSSIVAIIVYALLAWAISSLLSIGTRHRDI